MDISQARVGQSVFVDLSGTQASSGGAFASFGSGGMSGTITAVDMARGVVTVKLNGSVAGHDTWTGPASRVRPT